MKYFRLIITILTLILSLTAVEKNYAATFTVTNTNDSGAGSLRQAILDANVNNENDTIVFDMTVFSTPQIITLTSGQMVILPDSAAGTLRSLTINGPGANLLTISGNNHSRILLIDRDSRAIVDGLKFTGGNGTPNGVTTDINAFGGAILTAGGSPGFGLDTLILKNSIVSGNQAVENICGGGGLAIAGTVSIINSTISNNTSTFYGGAISVSTNGLKIINSTISHNTGGLAGGIYSNAANVYFTNSTVVFNNGTGINLTPQQNTYPILYSRNSIIANNSASQNIGNDVQGRYSSLGNNIIGNSLGTNVIDSSVTDQFNVDPLLDPQLNNNGGITPTHAFLSVGSPAIERGDNCVLTAISDGGCVESPLTTDQRGVTRPQDGDGDGTATVDIGAIEASFAETSTAPGRADLLAANDTGISDTDNITKSRNLMLTVNNVTSGVTVEFYRNEVLLDTVIATGNTLTFSDNNLPADGVFVYKSRQIVNNVPSLFSLYLSVTIDNTSPAVTVNQATIQFDPTTAQPLNFTASFNEAIVGFDSSDVSLADSTAGVSSANINVTGNSPTYNIAVSNIFPDGVVRGSIPANRVQDLAGNDNSASTSTDNSITLDNTAPTVTINQAAAQTDPTRNMPVNFTVVFSEPVTGFNNADVSLTGSTANIGSASITVTGSGANYNVAVSGISSNGGFVMANVRTQAATDAAGNQSVASSSTDNAVTVDNTSPTVTINQAAAQADPTSGLPINFTVVFSESVTGFDAADISFTGSTVSTTQATVNITGSGTTYNVAIGGTIVSNGGFLQTRVLGGGAQDAIGNLNIASTSTDNRVTIDNVSPTVTINQAIGQSDPALTQPVNFTVVFSELVTGFNAADVSLAGSTANVSFAVINVTGSGNVYTVSVRNITSGGQVRASVTAGAATDSIGNPSVASTSSDNSITVNVPNRSQLFDFDGDGKTDISIFRPSAGEWWYSRSIDGQVPAVQFGTATDKLVPADFTGDGKTDIAFWRESDGVWFVLRSEDNSYFSFPFGQAGDIPVVGDFDGDGRGDPTVFRPSTATWFISKSSGGIQITTFGQTGDVPVVGDYDGDGKSDVAIFRSNGAAGAEWWYARSSDNQIGVTTFGLNTDKAVQADYTGDGKTDIAFWRPSTGEWFILRSEDSSFFSFPFGASGDIPTPGDYDGDGKFDVGVFRPSSTTWFVNRTTAGILITNFGATGDRPVPNVFVP